MSSSRTTWQIPAVIAGLVFITSAAAGAAGAAPAPAPDRRCQITVTDAAQTIDSLRFHCDSQQIVDLYRDATAGTRPPTGRYRIHMLPVQETNGVLGPYQVAKVYADSQGLLGETLTFALGGPGQLWVYKEYISGRDAGGPLTYAARSLVDDEPAWTVGFSRDYGGLRMSTHEYRQIAPTMWIGRDFIGLPDTGRYPRLGGAMVIERQ